MKKYIIATGWGGTGNVHVPIEVKLVDGKVLIDLSTLLELNNEFEILKDEETKNKYMSL